MNGHVPCPYVDSVGSRCVGRIARIEVADPNVKLLPEGEFAFSAFAEFRVFCSTGRDGHGYRTYTIADLPGEVREQINLQPTYP